jgi:ubiquinone/menaquinone biosynthesis C-methylase UbiE/uncharacterized protein YbaR (Trm112 family)
MKRKLLDILACPVCEGYLRITVSDEQNGEIRSGTLLCSCGKRYEIIQGIPRFVSVENYADSFGFQWNRFRLEQIDTSNQTNLSERRFWNETDWNSEYMRGKWILDAGCGAGRFLEIASRGEAQVIGLDLSDAVDAAMETLNSRDNVHLVQASIYELPFKKERLDAIYCIGVIQHTPEPLKVFHSFARVLKKGGRLAVTIYEKKRFTLLNGKYLIRPFLRNVPRDRLLDGLKLIMPILFAITTVVFKLPLAGKIARFILPVANYVDNKELTRAQRYQWAIMDTFDMLSPAFDQPQTEKTVFATMTTCHFTEIRRLPNPGLNLVGKKL